MEVPFEPEALETERLRLRPLADHDVEDLFAIFSDRETMRYWSRPAWTTDAEGFALIESDREDRRQRAAMRLAIEHRASARVIGTASLFAFATASARAEIGYALHRAHWSHGYMREALTALIDYAFGPLALRRLEADIDPRNLASARSLERQGFLREGLLRERWRVGDEVSDSALYGLLRRDWRPA